MCSLTVLAVLPTPSYLHLPCLPCVLRLLMRFCYGLMRLSIYMTEIAARLNDIS